MAKFLDFIFELSIPIFGTILSFIIGYFPSFLNLNETEKNKKIFLFMKYIAIVLFAFTIMRAIDLLN